MTATMSKRRPVIQSLHSSKNSSNLKMNTTDATAQERIGQEEDASTFAVKVVFEKHNVEYFDSLVDLWSEWYRPYFIHATTNTSSTKSSSFPVLMIRHEDLLLHGPRVVQKIAQCMGMEDTIQRPYRYQTDSAKNHGSGTNLVQAVLQAGDAARRSRGGGGNDNGNDNDGNNSKKVMMTRDDLLYAASHLDHDMMKAFRYKFILPPP
jgi:hypothetical protein